ncbi:MAG: hypothetical protein IKH73_10100, partial [Erysipelotrichaceae bacterium]|nr:hypothetical protein [Erysipelotrichaceae bacterium]
DAEDNYIDAQENYNKVMANNQESRGIIDALKDTLNAMTDRRNSAQDLVDNYASSKQQKQEDLDKANNEYTEILNRKEDIQKEIENALNRKEELNSRINEANDARTVSESTYNRVNETVNNLKKNIEINLSIDFNDLKDVADKAKEAVDSAFAKINTIREKLNALLSLNEAEQMIDNAAGENITDQTVTDEQVSNENTSVADETDKQNTVIIHISEELPASDVSHDDAISEAINNDENVEIVFTSTSSENKQQNQEKENKHDAANESKNNKDKRLPVIEKTVEDDKQQNDKVNNKKQQADGLNPWVITAGFSTAAGLLFAIIRIMEMKKAIR